MKFMAIGLVAILLTGCGASSASDVDDRIETAEFAARNAMEHAQKAADAATEAQAEATRLASKVRELTDKVESLEDDMDHLKYR